MCADFQSLHDKCLYTDSFFESCDLQYIFFAKICAFQIPRSLEKIPLKAHRKERKRRRQDMKVGLSQDRLVMIIVWRVKFQLGSWKVPLSGSIEELKRKAQAMSVLKGCFFFCDPFLLGNYSNVWCVLFRFMTFFIRFIAFWAGSAGSWRGKP